MPRTRTAPVLNPALAGLLAAAGRPYAFIAARINRVAAENGIVLSCTAATLSKWVSGQTPLPSTRPAVVEALRRLLDRPGLTACDLGWKGTLTKAYHDDPWQGDPLFWIARLSRDDMLDRRTALYTLAAATLPATIPTIPDRPGPARRAGAAEVEQIRQTTSLFGDLDDRFGGGHARAAAAAYLAHEVAPLLQGTTGRHRPELFSAAASLACLLGWMAADDLKTGLSQRYYIQAAKLAHEADNPIIGSGVLRSLAVQAIELGHRKQAAELAEAAHAGLRAGAPARTRAWIVGMCAETAAAVDRRRAVRLLSAAETDLERADSIPDMQITGNYRRESFEHQTGLMLTQMGDHAGAEKHYTLSVAARRPVERRTRALIIARIATAQMRQHRPEDAARTILDASGDLSGISSARVHRHLAVLRAGWQRDRAVPDVAAADRLLTTL